MARYRGNSLVLYFLPYIYFCIPTNFCDCQAAQLAHIMAGRARDFAKEVEQPKGSWESAAKTAKDKLKAVESAEMKAAAAKKNRGW